MFLGAAHVSAASAHCFHARDARSMNVTTDSWSTVKTTAFQGKFPFTFTCDSSDFIHVRSILEQLIYVLKKRQKTEPQLGSFTNRLSAISWIWHFLQNFSENYWLSKGTTLNNYLTLIDHSIKLSLTYPFFLRIRKIGKKNAVRFSPLQMYLR